MSVFPLVEANIEILEPKGKIAICTNTSAPAQVINNLSPKSREVVSVLGSLIVNRDGAERMILNSIVHSGVRFLILFGAENNTFRASTNFLSAIMHGYRGDDSAHWIEGGEGAAHNYPNISTEVLQTFCNEVTVVPMFTPHGKMEVVETYIKFLQNKVPESVIALIEKAYKKPQKIYYDQLEEMIEELSKIDAEPKSEVSLDPKEYQALQPPIIELETIKAEHIEVPYHIQKEGKNIKVQIQKGDEVLEFLGNHPFRISEQVIATLGDEKDKWTTIEQLYFGAELSRVHMELQLGEEIDSFVSSQELPQGQRPEEHNVRLFPDLEYYYKMAIKKEVLSVQCLCVDNCDEVFDLRSDDLHTLLAKIDELNRFQKYKQDILHRFDVGMEVARAYLAMNRNMIFIQDFYSVFKVNTEEMPVLLVEGDSFLAVHQGIVRKLYADGITTIHPDIIKGDARTAAILATYRDTKNSMKELPNFYKLGEQSTEEMRENYKEQLLRFDDDGSYSYGQRTRAHFGFDQLLAAVDSLREHPEKTTVVQRFDPVVDMSFEKVDGEMKFTHDPCLTHDAYYIQDGKLHSLHIARAHNIVNAYPENVFGLHDAYRTHIAQELELELGDMHMLSNRGNILLLTESQRAMAIISESAKPIDSGLDTSSGPHKDMQTGLQYVIKKLLKREEHTSHQKELLLDYHGQNILEKSLQYFAERGKSHNNPILTTYYPTEGEMTHDGLLFMQYSTYGESVDLTAVFTNRGEEAREEDEALCHYVASRMQETVSGSLGQLFLLHL